MTNVMTKITSRQRILGYLGQHNGASAVEISRALNVSAANIRYHLSILVSDGRVQLLGFRPEQGKGRPVQIYGLGKAAQGDNLAGLLDVLLTQLLEKIEPPEVDPLLRGMAASLVPTKAADGAVHITRRLAQTVSRLDQFGYAARWEAHAAAPRVIFERCPYAAVIAKHPELCRMDGFMLEQQLGGSVEQTARLEKNARGTTFCQFVFKQS